MPRPPKASPRCDMCGDDFAPINPQQRFCNEECRRTYHQAGPAAARISGFLEKRIAEEAARLVVALTAAGHADVAELYLSRHPHRARIGRARRKLS